MCPACTETAAAIVAGITSTGGLTAVVLSRFWPKTTRKETTTNSRKRRTKMNSPKIVSRDEWLTARKELLVKEKEFTRARDALSARRRELPMVKIERSYVFEGPNGPASLRDFFGKHRQLIVYHFMFDPAWAEGCKSCSHFMDNSEGSIVHLAARDTAFVAVSRAPLPKIEAFKQRMGWTFQWFSSFGNTFNYDFHVTLDKDNGSFEYNYANAGELVKAGKLWSEKGELPGLSAFFRDGDSVFHTYSAYQRGLDLPLNTYNFLDFTPLGRQEEGDRIQGWIRHRDRYSEPAIQIGSAQ
jgi:predicted dithiol-disulfide oxidoreductase (DUF899 family)